MKHEPNKLYMLYPYHIGFDGYVCIKEAKAAYASSMMLTEKLLDVRVEITPTKELIFFLNLIVKMFVTGTYSINKLFTSSDGEFYYGNHLVDFLNSIFLEIEVDKASRKILSVQPCNQIIYAGDSLQGIRDSHEVLKIENDKTIVYQIHNLNIYLTAEVVQQLNINPQEVINNIHEQIKAEVDKTAKQENK